MVIYNFVIFCQKPISQFICEIAFFSENQYSLSFTRNSGYKIFRIPYMYLRLLQVLLSFHFASIGIVPKVSYKKPRILASEKAPQAYSQEVYTITSTQFPTIETKPIVKCQICLWVYFLITCGIYDRVILNVDLTGVPPKVNCLVFL